MTTTAPRLIWNRVEKPGGRGDIDPWFIRGEPANREEFGRGVVPVYMVSKAIMPGGAVSYSAWAPRNDKNTPNPIGGPKIKAADAKQLCENHLSEQLEKTRPKT